MASNNSHTQIVSLFLPPKDIVLQKTFHKNPLNGEDFDLLNDVNLPANLSLEDLELLVSVDQNETTGSYTDEELMDAAK